MSPLGQVVTDLESFKTRAGMQSRISLVRRLTDEFIVRLDQLPDGQIDVFDTVLFSLARDLDLSGRIELSEKLSKIMRAPYRTIRDFAMDRQHPVAAPVIEFSPRLSEADLVVIACHHGQEHLLSMTKRDALTELVTDLIIERGERAVQYSVASNPKALLSAGSLYKLQLIAVNDAILRESFVRRMAEKPARAAMAADAAPVPREPEEAGDESKIISGRGFVFLGSMHANEMRARDRFDRRPPAEGDVLHALEANAPGEAVAILGMMARVPSANVIEYMTSSRLENTLTLLRTASISWSCARAILEYKAGQPLSQGLAAKLEAGYASSGRGGRAVVREMLFQSRALDL